MTTFFLCGYTPAEDRTRILWSAKYKLKWEDFQGPIKSQRKPREQCATKSVIRISTIVDEHALHCAVRSEFLKNESWAIEGLSPELLSHEQLHFDITEMYARMLRKEIEGLLKDDPANIKKKIKFLYDQVMKDCIHLQLRYDVESAHSNNRDAQQRWRKNIDEQMNRFAKYESVNVDCTWQQ